MSFFESIKKFFGISSHPKRQLEGSVPRDDYAYNAMKKEQEERMNSILDKIASKGMESLTKMEKSFLDSQSKQS
ncbi:MAG: DUF6576 domain-containing protein [Flavobacteriales bacterium]|jgi:hypothetical protein